VSQPDLAPQLPGASPALERPALRDAHPRSADASRDLRVGPTTPEASGITDIAIASLMVDRDQVGSSSRREDAQPTATKPDATARSQPSAKKSSQG
jgi:hypothetical protein